VVAFVLYLSGLILFYWAGNVVSSTLGVSAGSQAIGSSTLIHNKRGLKLKDLNFRQGPLDWVLERICVPGVVLVAGLSGAGAVNTAWHAFLFRETGREYVFCLLSGLTLTINRLTLISFQRGGH
jgi:hypothetical protein